MNRLGGRDLLDDGYMAGIVARIDAEAGARALYGALAHLPEPERAVLELVAVDELPVTEAADALGGGHGSSIATAVAEGPVAPCDPVDAPAGTPGLPGEGGAR